ncbi:MAG: ribosome maturation factor RimP [Thermoleophilia bacterium]
MQREIEPLVHADAPDVSVLAVELLGHDRFCVFIDHANGVDLDLCERVSGLLRGYNDRYTVDVSSPGFDRPLRTREHFAAAVGEPVAVRTERELDGRKRFRGTVTAAGEDAVELELAGGGRVEVPYLEIVRANLIDEGR